MDICYKLPLSNSFANNHPNDSVNPAAVVALIAFPTPGIHPTNTCVTVLPTVDAASDPIAAFAADSVKVTPNTFPNEIVIVS